MPPVGPEAWFTDVITRVATAAYSDEYMEVPCRRSRHKGAGGGLRFPTPWETVPAERNCRRKSLFSHSLACDLWNRVFALACALLFAACAHGVQGGPASQKPSRLKVVMDFGAVDAWLACRRAGSDTGTCEAASAATTGGQIGHLARDTFGSGDPPTVPNPTSEAVAQLVEAMKTWPDVSAQVQRFFPKPVSGTIKVFVVANGHPWGDAYVRTATQDGANCRLAPDGEPVAVLNAVLIAGGYRGTPPEQASSALGVLRHEVFHVILNWYRRAERAWARLAQPTAAEELALLVLNEGIAHFVDRETDLLAGGFDLARGSAALTRLAEAARRLENQAGEQESGEILSSANQGKYWDKFGSVSGMLFAYGVFHAFGIDGIREAIRCGPGRFVQRYDEASRTDPELPKIPAELLAAWSALDLCVDGSRRGANR